MYPPGQPPSRKVEAQTKGVLSPLVHTREKTYRGMTLHDSSPVGARVQGRVLRLRADGRGIQEDLRGKTRLCYIGKNFWQSGGEEERARIRSDLDRQKPS